MSQEIPNDHQEHILFPEEVMRNPSPSSGGNASKPTTKPTTYQPVVSPLAASVSVPEIPQPPVSPDDAKKAEAMLLAFTRISVKLVNLPFNYIARQAHDDRWKLDDSEKKEITEAMELELDARTPQIKWIALKLAPELLLLGTIALILEPRLTMKPREVDVDFTPAEQIMKEVK